MHLLQRIKGLKTLVHRGMHFLHHKSMIATAQRARIGFVFRSEQVLSQLVRAMCSASLGEAQAVFASRAEAKKLSPKLLASIHLGASGILP